MDVKVKGYYSILFNGVSISIFFILLPKIKFTIIAKVSVSIIDIKYETEYTCNTKGKLLTRLRTKLAGSSPNGIPKIMPIIA